MPRRVDEPDTLESQMPQVIGQPLAAPRERRRRAGLGADAREADELLQLVDRALGMLPGIAGGSLRLGATARAGGSRRTRHG